MEQQRYNHRERRWQPRHSVRPGQARLDDDHRDRSGCRLPDRRSHGECLLLPAQSIVVVSGSGQSGPIGKPLLSAIVVKAVASDGVPVAGTTINFQAQGSGTASPASTVTDPSGVAQTTWTLGSVVGNQNMSVSIPNSPASTTVSATGTGSPTGGNGSAQLTLLSNNAILAAHGTSNIVTVLYQSNGTPIQGGFVAFTPGSTASGSVSASSVTTTDVLGHASVNWTLGTAPSESLIISAANASSVTPRRRSRLRRLRRNLFRLKLRDRVSCKVGQNERAAHCGALVQQLVPLLRADPEVFLDALLHGFRIRRGKCLGTRRNGGVHRRDIAEYL